MAHRRLPFPNRLEPQIRRPAGEGIRDYDLFYFEEDPSWQAEDAVIRRAGALFADLGVQVEVETRRGSTSGSRKFGYEIAPIRSARDGSIGSCSTTICIGIAADGQVYAPYGLQAMLAGVLRPNPTDPRLDKMRAKAEDYRARWPWLRVESA